MRIIFPPNREPLNGISLFLAGTIEMGDSVNWQESAIEFLQQDFKNSNVTIYNPRRPEWDSSWEQKETQSQFNDQVNWELNYLDSSDLVLMHFEETSKSPISLMELGYLGKSGKLVVSCPTGFYRRGNVEIFCTRNQIPLHENLKSALGAISTLLRKTL
jgi:hypothetical protein